MNMIPLLINLFGKHANESAQKHQETITPAMQLFSLMSGFYTKGKVISQNVSAEFNNQLNLVEEYFCPLLNQMSQVPRLCNLIPFIEFWIYL